MHIVGSETKDDQTMVNTTKVDTAYITFDLELKATTQILKLLGLIYMVTKRI